jgi:hypothetical protein
MRTTSAVLIAGLALAACERAEPTTESRTTAVVAPAPAPKPQPPKPAISTSIEPVQIAPAEPEPAPAPRPKPTVRPATGPLPVPGTVVPAEYRVWLRGLSKPEQQQIASYCRKHRQDFQESCGGIGPLHIPYPPFPRARMKRADDGRPSSLFASSEEWSASLTGAQRSYIDRECPGGEDQPSSDLCGDNTPLVVAFDGQPVQFTSGGAFAFQPGHTVATDWPTATTPWIALDRNGNGSIDAGTELFGTDTVLPGGANAVNGFVALAALDANGDGMIDARDPMFSALVLWTDSDGDQRSAPGELTLLASRIVSISLAASLDARCDARGNCEGERAVLTWRDGSGAQRTGAVVDVYLPRR